MTTRLAWPRYLELVEADGSRLSELARRDLSLPVPSCPGWTVRDVVEHLAQVYLHKIACTELGHAPEDWPPPVPEGDPVDRLDAARRDLLTLLADRGPDAPSSTWWPSDQTVGFWYRRMAHETAIHRYDVELALDATTPVDRELAVDGIDEVLQVCLEGDWSDQPADQWRGISPEAGAGLPVAILAGDHVWRVTQHPDRVDVEEGPGEAVTSIGGDPADLVLWLWGRVPTAVVEVSGDTAVAEALHDRMTLATQ